MAAPLSEESQAAMDIFNKYKGGANFLSRPLSALRQIGDATDPPDAFDYEGSREEKTVPSSDEGVDYSIPVTILKPNSDSEVWYNIMIFFHGGGWVWSSRKSHMRICEIISQKCNCIVVNVEYRLSPEHKFPACYVDAEAVVRWTLANRIEIASNTSAIVGVAGDASGGNIAASICHLVKDAGICYQILIDPILTLEGWTDFPSHETYSVGYMVTDELVNWFTSQFLRRPDEASEPLCSPLRRETFADLPAALIVLAECNPTADHGSAYKHRLDVAGVNTDMLVLKGSIAYSFMRKPAKFPEAVAEMINCLTTFLSKLGSKVD